LITMDNKIVGKKIAPAAINALKEALTHVYWYKSDLRSFLTHCISEPAALSGLNWTDNKRNIVASLIDFLAQNEDIYQRQLIRLMDEVSKVSDYSHLARLEDGEEKVVRAKASVAALQSQIRGLQHFMAEEKEIERRRQEAHERRVRVDAVKTVIDGLTREYLDLISSVDAQARGYRLEKLLYGLFEIFDLDPKASFKVTGEQIDGAFTFESTDYLLEAKWHKDPMRASDLDALAGKLSRKLDNTLGLYLSINGYSEDGVRAHSSGRRLMLLMDGSDLMAVLEGRIDLLQLLLRKRRAAAQTGNIYLKIHEILTGGA
jgi:hypothetical protein